jgi:murein DD-endopeptidase MepM/ murein hydrolase activator NlpD
MDSIPHSEMTKPVCGEGQRRVRTSAAAIGLAISMGAATMALPKPSNASVISESNNETHKAASEQPPEIQALEVQLEDTQTSASSEAQASSEDLASALMVPSIDKTAVIPEDAPDPSLKAAQPDEVSNAEAVTPKAAEPQYLQYTVRRNQTLWQIASAYRVGLDEIAQANGIPADSSLSVGQVLNIPIHDGMNRRPEFDVIADANEFTASRKVLEKAIDVRDYSAEEEDHASEDVSAAHHDSERVAYVAPLLENASGLDSRHEFDSSDQPSQIAATTATPHRSLISRIAPSFEDLAPQSEAAAVPSVLNTRRDDVHLVTPGETLSSVASRYGVDLDDLIAANGITNPDNLRAGQELVVPSSSSTGRLYGSIAALPNSSSDAEAISGIVAPNTPHIAAPASRIAAVSRRDRSLEADVNPRVSAAPSVASPAPEQLAMAPATVAGAESNPSVNYAASLRSDIDRLRLRSPLNAVINPDDSNTIAAAPANLELNVDSSRGIKPVPAREMASLRVNPEFAARDSVREASTAASIGKLTTEDEAVSGVVSTPTPAPLLASSDVSGTAPEAADTVAVAPLGSSNYAPVLPPRAVSPDIPALAAVGEYLPTVGSQFNGYIWPAQGVLTSGYGWRWGRMHNGIDIGAPTGTPIVAAAPGVVTYARWNSGGYGNLVEVTHPDGSLTLYAHNNRILVEEGEQVEQGQHIADMGSTGFSTGPHLHFELHSAGEGVVNPIAYLP